MIDDVFWEREIKGRDFALWIATGSVDSVFSVRKLCGMYSIRCLVSVSKESLVSMVRSTSFIILRVILMCDNLI